MRVNKIINILRKNWLLLLGGVIGGLAGYIYWIYVGCETGNCPITASPIRTTLYWALMGGLIFSLFKRNENKRNNESK